MSTVPDHPATTRPETAKIRAPRKPRDYNKASFRYGYRYQEKKLPDGSIALEMVPLTLEDVLHPRDGDCLLPTDSHVHDCKYLLNVVEDRLAGDRSVVVLSDCGVYWDIPGLRHHNPDLAVIFGVKKRKDWKSSQVKIEKVRPSLIVEVTSRNTRKADLKIKVEQYARAGVLHYVIADSRSVNKKRRLTLIPYRLDGAIYRPVPVDKQGRAWLEPVGLWLGVTIDPETGGDRLVLIDPVTNEEIGDYTAVRRALDDAEARAQAEAQARIQAEARNRELEAEIRRLRGQGTS